MTALTWDDVGERFYETGVDHGILYPRDDVGDYSLGVAWNGLTTITESPAGADATPTYADNIKYLNLISVETFDATINAYTYPDEFGPCDGSAAPSAGLSVGQQSRQTFGLCYRTQLGNDIDGTDHGYKLHLVYGATAKPSQKAYASINDQPSAIDFGWDITTIPVAVSGMKPTASMTIDSTKVNSTDLDALLLILEGTVGVTPRLPLPDEVIALFAGTATAVDLGVPANQPTYNSSTHVVTLPSVAHITWKINGVTKSSGAQPAMSSGQVSAITAVAAAGYYVIGDEDWTFNY